MQERRKQLVFKCKREHITKVNIPNLVYLNSHVDTELPLDSRNHVTDLDTVKFKFNFHIDSADKNQSTASNQGRA